MRDGVLEIPLAMVPAAELVVAEAELALWAGLAGDLGTS